MTRKKVKLLWIANDAARKASLKKRRAGLLKKVSELSTLCGVNCFVIIYSPDDPQPVFWPSRSVVEELLLRFKSIPEMLRTKKMTNQESYLKERINKLQDQVKKHGRKKFEIELCYLMHQLYQAGGVNDLRNTELKGLVYLIKEKMKDIRKKIEYFDFSFHSSHHSPTKGDGDANEGNSPMDASSAFQDQRFNDATKHKKSSTGASSSTMTDIAVPHPCNDDDGCSSLGTALSIFRRRNVGDSGANGHGFCFGLPHHAHLKGYTGASLYQSGLSRGKTEGGNAEVNYFNAGLAHGNMGDNNNKGGKQINLELPHVENFDMGPNHQNVLGLALSHGNVRGLSNGNSPGSYTGGHVRYNSHTVDGSSGSDTGVNGSFEAGNDDPIDASKTWLAKNSSP